MVCLQNQHHSWPVGWNRWARGLALLGVTTAAALAACSDAEPGDLRADEDVEVPAPLDMSSFDATLAASIRAQVQIVDQAKDQFENWRSLGYLYEAHQMNGLALRCYEQTHQLAPEEERISYRVAVLRGREGNLEAALEVLAETLQQAPDYGPAHLRAGAWTLELGRLEQARAHYERAQPIQGVQAAARLGLAQVDLAEGQWSVALERLGNPQDYPEAARSLASQLMGTALARLGREEEARAALAQGRGAKPYLPDPWTRSVTSKKTGGAALYLKGARMLERGRIEQATQLLEQARAALGDRDEAVLRSLAEAYSRSERFEEAESALTLLSQRPQVELATWVGLGRVRWALGDGPGAQQAWGAALKVDPSHAETHALRVTSRTGQGEELLAAVEQAREQGVAHPEIELAAGKELFEREAFEQALGCFERSTELAPDWVETWVGLALTQQRLGSVEAARSARDRAATLDANHPMLPALNGILDGTSEETPR